jgi:hypothetical protein
VLLWIVTEESEASGVRYSVALEEDDAFESRNGLEFGVSTPIFDWASGIQDISSKGTANPSVLSAKDCDWPLALLVPPLD